MDNEVQHLFKESWPKKCGCGVVYSEEAWENLQYVGLQKVPPDYGIPDMELRNCSHCSSTLACVVPNDFA